MLASVNHCERHTLERDKYLPVCLSQFLCMMYVVYILYVYFLIPKCCRSCCTTLYIQYIKCAWVCGSEWYKCMGLSTDLLLIPSGVTTPDYWPYITSFFKEHAKNHILFAFTCLWVFKFEFVYQISYSTRPSLGKVSAVTCCS